MSSWNKDFVNYTRNEWRRCKTTLETSGEDAKLHSKRLGKGHNYTRNEWRRCKTTLGTSGEDATLTRNEWERGITALGTSGEDATLHSKRVGKGHNYTRNEWERGITTLETSVFSQLFSIRWKAVLLPQFLPNYWKMSCHFQKPLKRSSCQEGLLGHGEGG
jgi:hypothetical protein